MNRRWIALGAAAAVIALAAIAWWLLRDQEPRYEHARRVSYQFEVKNMTNRSVQGAKLWVYAPLPIHPAQRLSALEVDGDYSLVDDEIGNRIVEFNLDPIPPYGTRDIRLNAVLDVASERNRWQAPTKGEWLQPQPGIESDAPAIKTLAEQLGKRNAGASVAAIEAWLRANLKASDYDAVDRGALYALEQGRGDCTEFAYLAVALARALGLPARAVDGWVIEGDAVLEAAAFHTWAEVWDGRTWRLLDAHREAGLDDGAHHAAMRIVAPTAEAFSASFTRFRFEGEGITVRMR